MENILERGPLEELFHPTYAIDYFSYRSWGWCHWSCLCVDCTDSSGSLAHGPPTRSLGSLINEDEFLLDLESYDGHTRPLGRFGPQRRRSERHTGSWSEQGRQQWNDSFSNDRVV
jgi:hypothetical protein